MKEYAIPVFAAVVRTTDVGEPWFWTVWTRRGGIEAGTTKTEQEGWSEVQMVLNELEACTVSVLAKAKGEETE